VAQQCFRNTVLEDFRAGITPYSEAGDYSDVSVRTPAGEIPWSKLSRLSDEEMKTLMIDVVDRTYWLLQTLGLLMEGVSRDLRYEQPQSSDSQSYGMLGFLDGFRRRPEYRFPME